MKIYKLYIGIALSMTLLFLGGCNTEMKTPSQSEISNMETPSQMETINTHTTVFKVSLKELTDNGGVYNGNVEMIGEDKISAIYFEMVDDVEIEVDFGLVPYKGGLEIVYVSPDETETVIVDASEADGKVVEGTVTLTLEKGLGEIEFRGDNTVCNFGLTFQNMNTNNVSYFDIVPQGASPTNIPTGTASNGTSSQITPQNVDIVIENNVEVWFQLTTDNKISVDYDSRDYDVDVSNENGKWKAKISYIGNAQKYPPAIIYIPYIAYDVVTIKADMASVVFRNVFQHANTINVDMTKSSIFYIVPKGFTGNLFATTTDSYLELSSDDKYKDCDVTITDCASYGDIAPDFTKTENILTYSNGRRTGIINFDFKDGGYAIIK